MAGSHVWVARFSIVHAHPESGYVYQRYPSTGFRCCNPMLGRVILTQIPVSSHLYGTPYDAKSVVTLEYEILYAKIKTENPCHLSR